MAKFLSFRDGGQTDEQGVSQFIDKLFSSEVITGFKVTQQDTPNIGVKVTLDGNNAASAMIPSGDVYPYMIFMDAAENVSLATPDGSNPRIDLIVAYVDLSVVDDTNPNNPGAFLLENITGTPSGSPAVPNTAAIQAVIGASNPYIILAQVAVAAGASTITNANITDLRNYALLAAKNPALLFDYVESGCVWSGDSYGSTRNASMTAGVICINGKRLAVALVSARTFTASKDTYIDIYDSGGTTAGITYTEVSNNAASPSLASGSIRIGIIVTGASSIANVGSVNQGQENKVLPIVSSVPYAVTDSLGNLICPRDPQRRLLGYRQIIADASQTPGAGVYANITGLLVPVIVPDGRKIKITISGPLFKSSSPIGEVMYLAIREDTTELNYSLQQILGVSYNQPAHVAHEYTPSAGLHVYLASYKTSSTGNCVLGSAAISPASLKVELS